MLHDGEIRLGESALRGLLREQCPEWAGRALAPMSTSGTEHATWRLGEDLMVRLPLNRDAETGLHKELSWLPGLTGRLPLATPEVAYAGSPTTAYPYTWAVMQWLEGEDLSSDVLSERVVPLWADALGDLIAALREFDLSPRPAAQWPNSSRGGTFAERVEGLEEVLPEVADRLPPWLADRVIAEALDADVSAGGPVLLHGDLIPGNLLEHRAIPRAVIDFGTLTTGDPAWDLTPAWWVLDRPGRQRLRSLLEVDEQQWARGRGFALVQAVFATWYYTPKAHPLAGLGDRALSQIADDFT